MGMKKTFAVLLSIIMAAACASCAGGPEPAPAEGGGTVYIITDYYDDTGGFSSLGQALDEENSEKTLTVNEGDALAVGDREYIVTAETLTLSFYTQPSLDEVVVWWVDYCEGWKERGGVK